MSNAKVLTECVYDNSQVRVLGTKNEPWFVAVDVLKILGIHTKNISRILEVLDSDEKSVVNLTTEEVGTPIKLMSEKIIQGSHNTVWIVSEPGLYKIMLNSRTEKAKKFTRWVTHDVIPRIRKYGYYKLTLSEQKTNALNSIMDSLGVEELEKKYSRMTLSELKQLDEFYKNEKNAKMERDKVKEKYPYTLGEVRGAIGYYKWIDQAISYHDIKHNKKFCYALSDGTLLFSEKFKTQIMKYVSDPSYEWED